MDLLKAEIERKKKQNELAKTKIVSNNSNGNSGNIDGNNKSSCTNSGVNFIRQTDLKLLQEKELEEKQRLLDQQREERITKQQEEEQLRILKKRKLDGNNGGGSVSNNTNSTGNSIDTHRKSDGTKMTVDDYQKLSVHEIKLKLRSLGEPITLFGEDTNTRVARLVEVSNLKKQSFLYDDDTRFKIDSGELEEAKFEADDLAEEEEAEVINKQKKNKNNASNNNGSITNNDNNYDDNNSDSDNDSHKNNRKIKSDTFYDPSIIYSKMVNLTKEKVIYKFFRSLIKQWESDLDKRSDVEKRLAKGKMETKTQKQCKDYIRPLFKLLKKEEVPLDILYKLFEMVELCEAGNFRGANDRYISTAIGNAAWPIGLTMVGIHERSGRERISTSKVAHMMNNEMQRKYLTSVKRLISYAQSKRPDVPPSMKVM